MIHQNPTQDDGKCPQSLFKLKFTITACPLRNIIDKLLAQEPLQMKHEF